MARATKSAGRPRSEASRSAILEAALAELVRSGYDGLSLERVAARAGAGKATIYRWWSSRAELAVEAFFTETRGELAFPETGDAREDFRSQILALGALLREERGRAFAAMVAGARTDPDVARALGERWLAPRRVWGRARMERAIAEGACVDGLQRDAALAVLYGPLYTPLLFGQSVPSAQEIEAYLAVAFRGIFR